MRWESALPGAVSVFGARVHGSPACEGSGSGCKVSPRPGRGEWARVGAPGESGRPRLRMARAGVERLEPWPGLRPRRRSLVQATQPRGAGALPSCARFAPVGVSAQGSGGARLRRPPPPANPARRKVVNTDERRKWSLLTASAHHLPFSCVGLFLFQLRPPIFFSQLPVFNVILTLK